jgi:hypothetical protein
MPGVLWHQTDEEGASMFIHRGIKKAHLFDSAAKDN